MARPKKAVEGEDGDVAVAEPKEGGALVDLVDALNERVGLLSTSVKELTLTLEGQKSKIHQITQDLGHLVGVLGAQYGEPVRTKLANIVLHHRAPTVIPPEPTSSVVAAKK